MRDIQENPHLFQMPLAWHFHCRSLSRLLSIFLETKQVLPRALQALFHLGASDLLLALWALLVWWVCDLNQFTFLFNSLPWLQELRLKSALYRECWGASFMIHGAQLTERMVEGFGYIPQGQGLLGILIHTAVNMEGRATGNAGVACNPSRWWEIWNWTKRQEWQICRGSNSGLTLTLTGSVVLWVAFSHRSFVR